MMKTTMLAFLLFFFLATDSQAGIGWELKAARTVERKVEQRYPTYIVVVICDSTSRRTFACEVSGFDDDCFLSGNADVKRMNRYRYRVRNLRVLKECF